MLRIAVCDDEQLYLDKARAMLEQYAAAYDMEISVKAFSTPSALLDSIEAGERHDILSSIDADKISDYAAEAFRWACSEGIVGGYDDGTLRALTNASRAHAAAMMMRFCASAVK